MQFIKLVNDGSEYYVSNVSIRKSEILGQALNGTNTDRVFYDQKNNTMYIDADPKFFKYIISILRGYDNHYPQPENSNWQMDYKYFINKEDIISLADIGLNLNIKFEIDSEEEEEDFKQDLEQRKNLDQEVDQNTDKIEVYNIDTTLLFSKDKKELNKLMNDIQDSLSSAFMPQFIDSFSNDKNVINLVKQQLALEDDSDMSDQEDFHDLV